MKMYKIILNTYTNCSIGVFYGKKRFIKEIFFTIVGTLFAGFGMASFLLPNKLSSGGFTGIATIFYYFLKFDVGKTVIILNIPFLFGLL